MLVMTRPFPIMVTQVPRRLYACDVAASAPHVCGLTLVQIHTRIANSSFGRQQ